MKSLHLATGEDATVWVTPQNQIIIAYSGTTGGTNLLFNPLIAISQLLTDFQAGFGNTTPKAFTQALEFAQQVQAEAAVQGYPPDSIFVTGHSLGGWEAQYVAQQIGLSGIGFETPGLSTTVAGNGSEALFTIGYQTVVEPSKVPQADGAYEKRPRPRSTGANSIRAPMSSPRLLPARSTSAMSDRARSRRQLAANCRSRPSSSSA